MEGILRLNKIASELLLVGYEGMGLDTDGPIGSGARPCDQGLRVRAGKEYRLYEELDRRALNLAREFEYLLAKKQSPGEYLEVEPLN